MLGLNGRANLGNGCGMSLFRLPEKLRERRVDFDGL